MEIYTINTYSKKVEKSQTESLPTHHKVSRKINTLQKERNNKDHKRNKGTRD